MQVVVDSLMTSYEKVGNGSVVLMLHGWGDTRGTFLELAKALAGDYTVVALDLPGFGGTQPPPVAWGLDDYCDFIADFLTKVGIEDLYCVVGHSNGGAIAIRGLASKKLRARKVVLLASAGIRNVYRGRKKALRIAAKAAKIATSPLPKRLQNALKKRAYSAIGSDLFVAEHMQETFKRVVTDDVQADARHIGVPSLIVYGSQDNATPPSYGELFKRAIPKSTLHILDGASHFVHHDKPREVRDLIQEFLS